MSCPITLQGYSGACKSMGGVRKLFVADRSPLVSDITVQQDVITDLQELEGTFVEYKLRPRTVGFESTPQFSSENNALYFETTLEAFMYKMSKDNSAEFMALAIGDLAVVIEDNNGTRWFLGFDNPVEMTEGTVGTGIEGTDRNGYSFTLTDYSKAIPYEVDSTVNLLPTTP